MLNNMFTSRTVCKLPVRTRRSSISSRVITLLSFCLSISVCLVLTLDASQIWFISNSCGVISLRCGCRLWVGSLIKQSLLVLFLWRSGSTRSGTKRSRCYRPRRLGRPWGKCKFGAWWWDLFKSKGSPIWSTGQCTLLIRLGGSRYAANHLLVGTHCYPCNCSWGCCT